MAFQPPVSLHRRIQELLLGFSRGISDTLSVSGALKELSSEVNALFGTVRVSVWIHDRRARELALAASSDGAAATAGSRVHTESDTIPARGLRLDGPQFAAPAADGARMLVAPLRGWRRALGTLVIEGEPRGFDDEQFVDAVHDLAVQLSFALENVQFIKVDVEGSELEVLAGARETIARDHPGLLLELLSGTYKDPLAVSQEVCATYGYSAFVVDNGKRLDATTTIAALKSNTTWGSPIATRNVLFL